MSGILEYYHQYYYGTNNPVPSETADDLYDYVAQLEAENEQLHLRECPVCGRKITVLHELAAHMMSGEPCPGSCSLVRADHAT